jgi:hypothetical protein
MSSLLKTTAIALLALSLALPALAAAEGAERGDRIAERAVASAMAPAEWVDAAARPATTADGVLRAASEERSGDDRSSSATPHLDATLDGEIDDLESIDPLAFAGSSPALRLLTQRTRALDPTPHGFSEGLYGARASRGPPRG